MLIQGAGGAVVIDSPDFVEQPVPTQNFTGMGEKNMEQFYFPFGKIDIPAVPYQPELKGIDGSTSEWEFDRYGGFIVIASGCPF